jgi:Sulfotransferase family
MVMANLDAMSPSDIVFVGGTGRSGTHVVAHLLGHHSRYHAVPIECRFHCNPKGLADVVDGRATPEEFVTKLRRFWWHRVRLGERATIRLRRLGGSRLPDAGQKVRGLHKIVPEDRFETAVARFEASATGDVVQASRDLFLDLLSPLAEDDGKPALVEMSCFTIAAAPGLGRIFPEARFVHAVRDGRDSGSSKVSKRQKRHHPTDARSGIEWWEGRLRLAEDGTRALDRSKDRLLAISLDELVWGDREGSYGQLLAFCGIDDEPAMRDFFEREMNAGAAHRERWREGLEASEQDAVDTAYRDALARIEAENFHPAPLLRRSYERTHASV